jgi:hypothetical protein
MKVKTTVKAGLFLPGFGANGMCKPHEVGVQPCPPPP